MVFLLFLRKVWTWIKKYWKYLLFPVGIVLGIIAMVSGRRRVGNVVAPGELETEGERTQANEEAQQKAREAAEAKKKAVESLEREHADTIKKLTDQQKKEVDGLRGDPDKLNEFLLGVGKEVRGG